jgi:hypothetical protein
MARSGRIVLFCVVASLGAASAVSAQAPAAAPPAAPAPESVAKAEQVLVEARKALGGEKLASVKTVVANGQTRRVRGNNLVPIDFEILFELPDKYLRVDEFPAEDTDPTSAGFNGDALIQVPALPAGPAMGRGMSPPGEGPPAAPPSPSGPTPAAPGAATGKPAPPPAGPPGTANPGAPGPPGAAAGMGRGGRGPAPDPRRARVSAIKQDYARLALGLFAASSAYPLTFSYAAMAEAPQGQADVLDAKGEGGFSLRYFVNRETRLPIMVTWTTPPTNVVVTVPGQPPPKSIAPGAVVVAGPPAPPANAPKDEMDKYAKEVLAIRSKAQATPVEQRLYFADYREVDGVKLPFRLRRAIGAETTEETTFERFRINTRIDSRKFEPLK